MTAGSPVISRTFRASAIVPGEAALRDLEPDAGHGLLEQLPVLAHLDRAPAGPDEPDPEPVEDAPPAELDREVERRLPAHGRQQRVRPLALEDGLDRLRGERLDVRAVRVLGVGHDRGRVRVDERDAQAFLLEGLDGLRARVVELAGLPDHDRPGADHQHRLDRRVPRHGPTAPPGARASSRRTPRRGSGCRGGRGWPPGGTGRRRPAGRASGSPRPCRRSG